MPRWILIACLLCNILAVPPSPCTSAETQFNLGTVRVELTPQASSPKHAISFRLLNTKPLPVRYFSITCKVLKEGSLIDERIINGFGIEPNGAKDLLATFLWLPPVYNVEFEANAIRMDTPKKNQRQQGISEKAPHPFPEINDTSSLDDDPMALIDNPYKVGEKYTIFNENGWVSGQ